MKLYPVIIPVIRPKLHKINAGHYHTAKIKKSQRVRLLPNSFNDIRY